MINNSGNVGIGTASPGYKLDVQTSTANDQAVRGSNTATTGTNYGGVFQAYGSGATTNVGGYFLASGATNNYGLIVEAGNVGIGTASPATKLDVSGQARATLGFLSTGTTLIQGANNNDSTKGRYRVYMDGGTSRNSVQMIVNISVAVTAHVNFIRVTFIERNTGTEAGNQQYVAVSEWVTDSNSVVTGGAQVRSVNAQQRQLTGSYDNSRHILEFKVQTTVPADTSVGTFNTVMVEVWSVSDVATYEPTVTIYP